MNNGSFEVGTVAKSFGEIVEKFNPYHDRLGRFTTAGGAASFTIRTRSGLWQGANDKAIERAKEQHAKTMPTAEQESTLKGIETRTRNLKKEQLRVVDREGNVILTKQGDKHSVSYSVGEARDNFHGNITIHNHPEGGTFSSADLSDIGYGATEIRAASPEGTYILRNMRVGQKWSDQKSWYEMREDYDKASESFKQSRQLKKEIRESHTKENEQMKKIADKWEKARNSGASQDELNAIANEYNKISDALKAVVESEVRTAFTNQHHNWIKANSANYGLEYEFRPIRTRTRKSFYEEDKTMVSKANDEIVLDRKLNNDIAEVTAEIMDSFGSEPMAKTFSEIIEKFNPYHDRLGRFSSSGGAASFTFRTKDPSKQHMADRAVAREKEKSISSGSVKAIVVGTPDGRKLSYRQQSNGVITDLGINAPAKTNGMTIDQIHERAKKLGWKVTTYDDNKLKDYDIKRIKDQEESSKQLAYDELRGPYTRARERVY